MTVKIGENIRSMRIRRKMTIEELAIKARIGKGTIEKYENGLKTPDTQTLLKLSTILDIPASEFYIGIS